jgi:hypothetical protein
MFLKLFKKNSHHEVDEHFQGAHQGAEHQQLLTGLKPHGIGWQLGKNAAIVVVGVGVHNGRWRGGHFGNKSSKIIQSLIWSTGFKLLGSLAYNLCNLVNYSRIIYSVNSLAAKRGASQEMAADLAGANNRRTGNGIFYANEIINYVIDNSGVNSNFYGTENFLIWDHFIGKIL